MKLQNLEELTAILRKVEAAGLTCTIDSITSDSCGTGVVLVTVDESTAETYHDLLLVNDDCVWEVCPGNGYDIEPLTAKAIKERHKAAG